MWYPEIMSKYLSGKYLLLSKKTGVLVGAVQKIDFLGSHFGRFPGESPLKISGDKIPFAAQQFWAKIGF